MHHHHSHSANDRAIKQCTQANRQTGSAKSELCPFSAWCLLLCWLWIVPMNKWWKVWFSLSHTLCLGIQSRAGRKKVDEQNNRLLCMIQCPHSPQCELGDNNSPAPDSLSYIALVWYNFTFDLLIINKAQCSMRVCGRLGTLNRTLSAIGRIREQANVPIYCRSPLWPPRERRDLQSNLVGCLSSANYTLDYDNLVWRAILLVMYVDGTVLTDQTDCDYSLCDTQQTKMCETLPLPENGLIAALVDGRARDQRQTK